MLEIQRIGHLANILSTTSGRLEHVANRAAYYYRDMILSDPARPDKPRNIVNVTGDMRRFQDRLLRKIFQPGIVPSQYSHGGIKDRNIKTNALAHVESDYIFKTDVKNFYPSIRYERIYSLFTEQFHWSPDVASICTKLCTFRHHLALGLITSPILADRLMLPVDRRIGEMCRKASETSCGGYIVYTRYVDDLTISGNFPIDSGSFRRIVKDILNEHGFKVNPIKHAIGTGRFDDGQHITNLEVVRGKLRVCQHYFDNVLALLKQASKFAKGGEWIGLYYTRDQIYGKVQYIAWINRSTAIPLLKLYNSITWKAVEEAATLRGLVAVRKLLVKKSNPEN